MGHSMALLLAGLAGALAIALGAFGAHALEGVLDARGRALYDTGARYHLAHAVAMLAAGCAPGSLWNGAWIGRACAAWALGLVVFSGSLYALALGAPSWLGAVAPVGGTALVAGWILVVIAARTDTRGNEP